MTKTSYQFYPIIIILVITGFMLLSIAAVNAAPVEYGKIVSPFKLEDVRLTSGTRLYNMMNANKNYLLSLNNDNILYNFRQTAGLSAPGSSYGGWEASSVELRGHFMGGHLLSALAKLYASSGEVNCKNKADYLVAELAKCQNAMGSGYLSAYPSSVLDRLEANTISTWAPYYTLHKILAGLMDCYKYCGNTTALDMEKKLAAYIKGRMDKLSKAQIDAFLETRPFVWNFYHEHGGIGESLRDLYQVTGDADTLALANIFDRAYLTDPLADNVDDLGYQEYHANSHIPMVLALARNYEVTNDTKYRSATINFLQMMTGGHTFPTGGTSGTSPSRVQNMTAEYWSYPGLFYEHTLGETGESCCTHNLNKITDKIFTWTADPKYADEYEKRFVNAVLSQQNPGNGLLLYNLSVRQGATKSFGSATNTFWCCTGSGVEAFASLAEGTYFNDGANGLYINQFIDSTLIWQSQGLTLKQTTNFPEEQGTKLQFTLSASRSISVKIRIPEWAGQGVTVKLNGAVQTVSAEPASYLVLNRTWNNGDLIELALPFNLRTIRMPDRPDYVAVMYGPQLLVACTSAGARFNGSESQLLSALTPVASQACTFTAALTTGNITFKPLNRVITETYNGYTVITSPLADTVTDYVTIADQTSETAHSLQSSGSSTGSANGKNWRAAASGGWFSYKLAVDSAKPMYVRCTYWGSDATNRVFYIQIDGNNIATQRLENNNPNNFFQLIYPVPVALTNGKSSVTVKFQPKSGKTAGGVFDKVEMLTYNNANIPTPTPTATPTPSPTPTPLQDPVWTGGPYTLNGTTDYVDVPDGITDNLSDFSVACWIKLNTVTNWVRIFDFGGDSNVFMMLTPASADTGFPYFAITTTGNSGEQGLNGKSTIATGAWQHFVITKSGNTGIMYINNQEVDRNTGMNLRPMDLGNTLNNYIGRSQWSHDPYLNANVDKFKIYNRAITPFEVASLYTASPEGIKGDVNGDGNVTIVDAMLIAQHVSGLAPAIFISVNADVNCDSTININDALLAARYAAGLVTKLGC